jgi:hypothetical protein
MIESLIERFLELLGRVKDLSLKTVTTLMRKTKYYFDQQRSRENFLRKRTLRKDSTAEQPKMIQAENPQHYKQALLSRVAPYSGPYVLGEQVVILEQYKTLQVSLGMAEEDYVTVVGCASTTLDLQYPPMHRTITGVPQRICMRAVEFNAIMKELMEDDTIIKSVPLFTTDQVVYVKPSRRIPPSGRHPQIGSHYETDLKILEINKSTFGTSFVYKLFSPTTSYITINEEDLITGQDKLKYLYADYREAVLNIDALPFFSFGERVLVYNNNVHNLFGTSVVPLTSELSKHLITKQ